VRPGRLQALAPAGPPFWARPTAALLVELRATPEGLPGSDAAARLARWGANDLEPPPRWGPAREVARYLVNPLVLVLLMASGVAAALGQAVSSLVIVAMIVLSVALNVTQSWRSQHAARRLRERVGHTATVVRDGAAREVPAREVVPGDVLRLAAGDLVAADARVLAAKDLFVHEAALTGESLPREKHAEPDAGGETIDTAVFRGTSVVSGTATAVVVHTGARTMFGHVVARLAARPPETEFERGTRRFGLLILESVVFLVLFVFLASALLRRDPLESLLFSLALAVGLTPELLPMIVSVTLARGAVHMAARKVVVKRLAAIENFGSMDVLCSDKTGTLTVGEIAVDRHVDLHGADDETVIRLAAVNSAFQTGLRSPLDDAILRHEHPAIAGCRRVDEIPFDFSRRRVSVVVDDGPRRLLVAKGAPEGVLPACAAVVVDGQPRPLDTALREEAGQLFQKLSAEGYRVLAVAFREVPDRPAYTRADERDLVLAGFAAFLDPARPDLPSTISALRADGVDVKILTGDNELVTRRICLDAGIAAGTIVLGDEVDGMSDAALAAVAERTTIFARVSPVQKNRIVQALRSRRHVVGYVGDGINDAPALRAADVGISVQHAAEVARDAADIILLAKGLDILHQGVVEGRRSFGNIMKYVLMGTSSNFGNMFSMAIAAAVLPFLPMLPLQILLNNFLYDLAQVTIPSDRVDRTWELKPRRWNVAFIRRYMLLIGPISSVFDLATFAVMLGVFHAGPTLFRTGWFLESLATQTLVIFVIRTAGRPWASRPSRALTCSVGGVIAVGMLLPVTPLAPWLGFTPLPPAFFAFLGGMVLAYLVIVELVKQWFYRRWGL
jgi:Mg2+-importing ATPase